MANSVPKESIHFLDYPIQYTNLPSAQEKDPVSGFLGSVLRNNF